MLSRACKSRYTIQCRLGNITPVNVNKDSSSSRIEQVNIRLDRRRQPTQAYTIYCQFRYLIIMILLSFESLFVAILVLYSPHSKQSQLINHRAITYVIAGLVSATGKQFKFKGKADTGVPIFQNSSIGLPFSSIGSFLCPSQSCPLYKEETQKSGWHGNK